MTIVILLELETSEKRNIWEEMLGYLAQAAWTWTQKVSGAIGGGEPHQRLSCHIELIGVPLTPLRCWVLEIRCVVRHIFAICEVHI